jgi:predicted acyltransferase
MAMSAPTTPSSRLVSLDTLRGFDMFWILGADRVVYALRAMDDTPVTRFLAMQLNHAKWVGFTFYDLIFPLFVFIVGVSMVFSLTTPVQHGRAAAVRRILVRATVLFLLGVFYNGGLAREWPDVRVAGVLQRIAIAYAAAGLLFVYLHPRMIAAVGVALLVGYWALLTYVPIRDVTLDQAALTAHLGPDTAARDPRHGRPSEPYRLQVEALFAATATEHVRGSYEPGRNLANHLDFQFLPGRMYDVWFDPEGILSTLPSIATCLLGVFAGLWLRRQDQSASRKAIGLAAAGVAALAAGHLWGLEFPVVKKLWTSSFVLVAGGWSLLLLAAFYYLVDIRGGRGWCAPFVWIGMNPIALFLLTSAIAMDGIARRFVGGSVRVYLDGFVMPGFGQLVIELGSLLLLILFARFLYRRRIFLRV